MQGWQRQKGSKGKVFAVRPRPVPGLSLRGGCTPGNSRRVAARDKSRLWQLASLVLIERPAHVRGGCTPGNSRRVAARDKSCLWQLASLVLIERPAHVRGGCTPGNSRRVAARDKSRLWQLASLVLIERPAHVRGGVPPLSLRGGCTPGNSRRVAARDKSRLGQLAVARAHRIASARARRSASAVTSRLGQLASLVLIEPLTHVRGPVPGLSLRGGCIPGAGCRAPAAPGLCDGKSALCGSIPQKETRPAAVAAGLSFYRGAPGRYSISQQSSQTPS